MNDSQNLVSDYHWIPRINTTIYGRVNLLPQKLNNPLIAVLAETTNINPSGIAGYLVQSITIAPGIAEVGERIRIPNRTLKIMFMNQITNYSLKFILATPVGHTKLKVWSAIPKSQTDEN